MKNYKEQKKWKQHMDIGLPDVKNFSRHKFNSDQLDALSKKGSKMSLQRNHALSPFFKDSADLIRQTQHGICSLVAPMGLLLEAIASGNAISGWNAIIIDWVADEAARKRGRFATRGMRIFRVDEGSVELIHSATFDPEVENDYKTGEEFPYEGGDSTR